MRLLQQRERPSLDMPKARATSAPGLGSPQPHLHRDWAHPCHICTGAGLTPAESASGTGLAPATSAPGLGSPLPHPHPGLDSGLGSPPLTLLLIGPQERAGRNRPDQHGLPQLVHLLQNEARGAIIARAAQAQSCRRSCTARTLAHRRSSLARAACRARNRTEHRHAPQRISLAALTSAQNQDL